MRKQPRNIVADLTAEADRYLDRAKGLRIHAGRARLWINRWVLMGMAHHLERKGAACLRDLVALRKAAKAEDNAQDGHRAARRRLHRDNS